MTGAVAVRHSRACRWTKGNIEHLDLAERRQVEADKFALIGAVVTQHGVTGGNLPEAAPNSFAPAFAEATSSPWAKLNVSELKRTSSP